MFKDTLFTIVSENVSDGTAECNIQLNSEHPIYKGHFPSDPITPGVCIVQMVTDLFSHIQKQDFVLNKVKNVKFIQIIRPTEHPIVTYKLNWEPEEDGAYKIKAIVCYHETVFSKISVTTVKSPIATSHHNRSTGI